MGSYFVRFILLQHALDAVKKGYDPEECRKQVEECTKAAGVDSKKDPPHLVPYETTCMEFYMRKKTGRVQPLLDHFEPGATFDKTKRHTGRDWVLAYAAKEMEKKDPRRVHFIDEQKKKPGRSGPGVAEVLDGVAEEPPRSVQLPKRSNEVQHFRALAHLQGRCQTLAMAFETHKFFEGSALAEKIRKEFPEVVSVFQESGMLLENNKPHPCGTHLTASVDLLPATDAATPQNLARAFVVLTDYHRARARWFWTQGGHRQAHAWESYGYGSRYWGAFQKLTPELDDETRAQLLYLASIYKVAATYSARGALKLMPKKKTVAAMKKKGQPKGRGKNGNNSNALPFPPSSDEERDPLHVDEFADDSDDALILPPPRVAPPAVHLPPPVAAPPVVAGDNDQPGNLPPQHQQPAGVVHVPAPQHSPRLDRVGSVANVQNAQHADAQPAAVHSATPVVVVAADQVGSAAEVQNAPRADAQPAPVGNAIPVVVVAADRVGSAANVQNAERADVQPATVSNGTPVVVVAAEESQDPAGVIPQLPPQPNGRHGVGPVPVVVAAAEEEPRDFAAAAHPVPAPQPNADAPPLPNAPPPVAPVFPPFPGHVINNDQHDQDGHQLPENESRRQRDPNTMQKLLQGLEPRSLSVLWDVAPLLRLPWDISGHILQKILEKKSKQRREARQNAARIPPPVAANPQNQSNAAAQMVHGQENNTSNDSNTINSNAAHALPQHSDGGGAGSFFLSFCFFCFSIPIIPLLANSSNISPAGTTAETETHEIQQPTK